MEKNLNAALRRLPAVQTILRAMEEPWPTARLWVHRAVQDVLADARRSVREGEAVPVLGVLLSRVRQRALQLAESNLRPVLNATGVIIHTNLGRSPLPLEMMRQVAEVSGQYSTLEYRLEEGRRGSRHELVQELLAELTGAEAAMVVNNNAAAVLLALAGLARGREVVVSRGELVEIGGSFRIPEVMALSGAILREVGATNKTHARDYESAISAETGLLLKVHQSNFRMIGFAQVVSTPDLVTIGRRHRIPVMEDLGSGVLVPLSLDGYEEPTVQQVVAAGVDVVTFSGDKLLGGPQAGVLVGRQELIAELKRYPLARAVRVDKMTLAALELTARWYLEGRGDELPLWMMIRQPVEVIRGRAERVLAELRSRTAAQAEWGLKPDWSEIGGGSMPGTRLPTVVMTLSAADPDQVLRWERALRAGTMPVVARISHGVILFDLRTIFDSQESILVDSIVKAVGSATDAAARGDERDGRGGGGGSAP
ncbi:MAG: L-seryl-tRNA(Sec) selenium transferase [Thermaerobacter sp.]|nr:L-seryl-tRNA(Sec) selenium transferase [Thermaerobacter sp.]